MGGLLRLLGAGYGPRPGRPSVPFTRTRTSYGPRRRQRGVWWVPHSATPLPVVVLLHGGYWRRGFDHHLQDAMAVALVNCGYAVWNVDYRPSTARWPATFTDAALALDAVAAQPGTDLSRVAVVGHSAGGQLALWLASRDRLPPGAVGSLRSVGHPDPPDPLDPADPRDPVDPRDPGGEIGARRFVRPVLVIAQAPVADLVAGAHEGLGGGAVTALMGGSPAQHPERYAMGSPQALLPPPAVRIVLVHGDADEVVPLSQSTGYAEASCAELVVLPGVGHFEHLDPSSSAGAAVLRALEPL